MPKMQFVTDEMIARAGVIGQNIARLRNSQTQVTRISESLWTKDDIQEKIHSAINEHVIKDHTTTLKTL